MAVYLWVIAGSALGGLGRYLLTRWMMPVSGDFPWGTVCINIVGCFVIGFGTLTVEGTKYAVPDNVRMFVMVGICGGFTTFSSFSLQTFDLLRSGAWGRALMNVLLSVVLCFVSVALGHYVAERAVGTVVVAQTEEEELTG